MNGRLPLALLAVGVLLLVGVAAVPVQPVLSHDSSPSVGANESVLEERGYQVIAYGNLSERGQDLYVRTLESGGQYSVPLDTGAPEFSYPTNAELASIDDIQERLTAQGVVVERPPDADLPPGDERVLRRGPAENESDAEAMRQRAQRYDLMTTSTARPSLTALSSLLRLFAVVAGVLAIVAGGYLRLRP